MSFKDLELDKIPFEGSFIRGEESGRKRIEAAIDRLESSWNVMSKMTMSIMAVSAAAVAMEDRKNARVVLEGMVRLFLIMSEGMENRDGGQLLKSQLDKESAMVDRAGEIMGEKVDEFGGAVMIQLLASLPEKWKSHLMVMQEVVVVFGREMDKSDADYLAGMIISEQIRMNQILADLVSESLSDDSLSMMSAGTWVKSARAMFTREVESGLNVALALSRTIGSLGFPDMREDIKNEQN
jgi:hypothetical protein